MTAYITGDGLSTVVIVIKMNGWDRRQTLVSFYDLQTERHQSNIECIVLHPHRHVLVHRRTVSSRFIRVRWTCDWTEVVFLNGGEILESNAWRNPHGKKSYFFLLVGGLQATWSLNEESCLDTWITIPSHVYSIRVRVPCSPPQLLRMGSDIIVFFFFFCLNSRYRNSICALSSSSRAVAV